MRSTAMYAAAFRHERVDEERPSLTGGSTRRGSRTAPCRTSSFPGRVVTRSLLPFEDRHERVRSIADLVQHSPAGAEARFSDLGKSCGVARWKAVCSGADRTRQVSGASLRGARSRAASLRRREQTDPARGVGVLPTEPQVRMELSAALHLLRDGGSINITAHPPRWPRAR